MRRSIHILFVLGISLTMVGIGQARSKRNTTYRYDQLWSTAVRFLRVDNRFPIAEKDKKDGYILFEYREDGQKFQGAIELIPTVSNGKQYIRLSLRIASMPVYVETVFLNRLMKKVRKEYGEPPPPQKVITPSEKNKGDTETKDKSSADDNSDESQDKKESQKE